MRLTWPEYLGIGLLLGFFVFAAATFPELDQMNWKRATARVVGISVKHDNRTVFSPIGSSNNGITVLYEYDTGKQTVTSEWSSNWLNTPILNYAAPTLQYEAEQMEVIDMNAIAEKTEKARLNPTFGETTTIADPRVGAPEVSRTLRGEDFYGVLAERRKTLSGVTPEMITADEINRIFPNLNLPSMMSSDPVTTPAATVSRFIPETPQVIQQAMELNVRFDPRNPQNSALDYPGFNLHLPVLLLDLALAILLVRYFARTYPRLKLAGY